MARPMSYSIHGFPPGTWAEPPRSAAFMYTVVPANFSVVVTERPATDSCTVTEPALVVRSMTPDIVA
jgi:hypothetical protein